MLIALLNKNKIYSYQEKAHFYKKNDTKNLEAAVSYNLLFKNWTNIVKRNLPLHSSIGSRDWPTY